MQIHIDKDIQIQANFVIVAMYTNAHNMTVRTLSPELVYNSAEVCTMNSRGQSYWPNSATPTSANICCGTYSAIRYLCNSNLKRPIVPAVLMATGRVFQREGPEKAKLVL